MEAHSVRFKIGDVVQITKDGYRATGRGKNHNFKVGSLVEIVDVGVDSYSAKCGREIWVIDDDCCSVVGEAKVKRYVKQYKVASSAGSSRNYTVSITSDGDYECSCLTWTRIRLQCKHIRQVRIEKIGEIAAVLGFTKEASAGSGGIELPRVAIPEPEPTPLEKIKANARWSLR
jgi:hypothetical protein